MQCFAEPAASVPDAHRFRLYRASISTVDWQQAPRREHLARGRRFSVRAPDTEQARQKLKDWLKQAAQERLAPPLLQLARDLNYSIERVAIRCQRTRWGSCSTRGTVSLNCSLVFLRPEVVRYLFVHELAHTRHMNHSPAFWRLVQSARARLPAARPRASRRLAHRAALGIRKLAHERKRARGQTVRRPERRGGSLGSHEFLELFPVPGPGQAPRCAAPPVLPARRDAVHRDPPGVGAVDEALPARAQRGGRLRAPRRSRPHVQDAGAGVDHPAAAAASLGCACDDHALRLFGIPQYARTVVGISIGAIPAARVPDRQQECRPHRGVPRGSADLRDARARIAARRACTTRCCAS